MNAQAVPAGRCPICKAPRDREFRPFCSARCAEIDLGRWFTGRYAIPAEEGPEPENPPPADPPDD